MFVVGCCLFLVVVCCFSLLVVAVFDLSLVACCLLCVARSSLFVDGCRLSFAGLLVDCSLLLFVAWCLLVVCRLLLVVC